MQLVVVDVLKLEEVDCWQPGDVNFLHPEELSNLVRGLGTVTQDCRDESVECRLFRGCVQLWQGEK